jgi:putative copper export protein
MELLSFFGTAFFCARKMKTGGKDMSKQLVSGKQRRIRELYWSMVGAACALIISVQPVMAETIWDRFSAIMQDIYGQLVAISTIVAVTVAAIALIVRMISRNQRAVDEATSWLKRIVVTWIVLNTLGFIVAYLQPLISGGQYTG